MELPLLLHTSPTGEPDALHALQQQQRHDNAIIKLLDSLFAASDAVLQQEQPLGRASQQSLLLQDEKEEEQEQQQQPQDGLPQQRHAGWKPEWNEQQKQPHMSTEQAVTRWKIGQHQQASQQLSSPRQQQLLPERLQRIHVLQRKEQQQQQLSRLLGVLHVAAYASGIDVGKQHCRTAAESFESCGCCAPDATSRAAAAASSGSFGRQQFLRALASDAALGRGLFSFLRDKPGGVCTSYGQQWETDSCSMQYGSSVVEAHATDQPCWDGGSAAAAAAPDCCDASFALMDLLLQPQEEDDEAIAADAASVHQPVFDMRAAFSPQMSPSLLQRFIRWKVLSPGLVDPFPVLGDAPPLRQESDLLLLQQQQQQELEQLHQEKAELQQQLHQLQERCRTEALQREQQRLREQQQLRQQQQQPSFGNSCSGRLQLRNSQNTSSSRDEAAAASMSGGPFASGKQLLQARRQRGLLSEDDEAALHALEQQQEEEQQARKKLRPHTSRTRDSEAEDQRQSASSAAALSHYEELLGGDVTPDILQWVLRMRLAPPERSTRGAAAASQGANEIAGLHRVKKLLCDKIINPILRPELHVGLHQAPRGILLFGPPGTGKTTLAKWMAAASGASFFEVTPSSIISKFQGETETLIKALFKVAECDSPSLIFIDEIDSLLGKRREKEDDASIRMKNQLLQMMDGVSSCSSDKILVVVGATNRPDMLDEAAIRRLTKRVLVPLPDAEAICVLIRNVLEGQAVGGCALTQQELQQLAARLDGWSGSDVRSLCVSASERSYDETVEKYGGIQFVPSRAAFRPISYNDFVEALKEVRPSCASAASLEFFDSWAKAHGAL